MEKPSQVSTIQLNRIYHSPALGVTTSWRSRTQVDQQLNHICSVFSESSFNTMKHVSKQLLHFVGHFPRNFMAECSHKDQQQKQPTIVAEQEKSPHSRVIGTNFKISILHNSAHFAVCIKMSSTNTTFTTFWIHSSSNELQDNKNWVQRRDESLCSTGEACLPSFHCTSSLWSGSHKNQFAVFLLT